MSWLFSHERFDQPTWMWLALIVVALWFFSRRSLAGLGPIRRRLTMGTRAVLIIVLVLALAGMHRVLRNDHLSVLYVLDVSKSVPLEIRRQAEEFIIDSSKDLRKDDRAAVLTFDGRTNIEQLPTLPDLNQQGIHVDPPFAEGQRPDQSNLAQALRMAAACARSDTNNRVVLISDGNQNVGDALEEAKNADANNITVDVLPLRFEHGSEVVFEQLRAPPYANLHENVALRMVLRSDRETTGEVFIYKRVGQNDDMIDLQPGKDGSGQRVTLREGRNAFTIRLPIQNERAHEFRAEFVPDDRTADVIGENNVARAFTNVEGPQTVLFIGNDADREGDELLMEALAKENIRVEWESAAAVDVSTATLQEYSAVILSNVGADNFSGEQQRSLANYVRDLGGGLIMLGGDDSFGAGGWQGSIVEDVMPVKFDVDSVRQIPRGALAIVMHSCEMPQGNKWGIETAIAALDTLSRLDYYGVVGWGAVGFHWEVPMQICQNKEAIKQKIRNMQNADMFDFDAPMRMAYNALMNCKDAAQRHMIIISDGDPQAPSAGLIALMRGNKVTCSTVSVFPHSGFEIGTMKKIADDTGGKYYSLSKPGDEKQLPKIFIKEAKIVRRPLIRDEIFVPKVRPHLSDILIGIDGPFPQLKGYVVTTPRSTADVEMPLVTKRGDPLLAHWLCGFGRTVAFTSGWWKRWGSEWTDWENFSKLWSQTVRWSMQQGSAANYDVTTVMEGDQGRVIIESMEDAGSATRFRQFQGRVISPDGESHGLELVQTGPGKYEATFRANQKGTYLVNVQAPATQSEKAAVIRTGVTLAYSPEFKDLTVNEALLKEVALETDGRILGFGDNSEKVFAHNLPEVVTRTPIWDKLIMAAIAILLLDVAFRRLAIDPLKSLRLARAYVGTLAGRFGAGRRAEATLADLRQVRERVREDARREAQVKSDVTAAPAEAGVPSIDAAKKFDAGPAAKKPGDMSHLTGTGPGAAPAAPAAQATKKDDKPQESTTARLLKARRRAQDSTGDDAGGGKP